MRGVRSRRIGYEQDGFHWQTASTSPTTSTPSRRTSRRASMPASNKDEGAGDQGIMFGFACDETPDLMPATLYYSHKILMEMASRPPLAARRRSSSPTPRARSRLRFEDGKPAKATAIVVSTQHKPGYDQRREAGRAPRLCEGRRRPTCCPQSCSATRPSITSTRPAASRSAAPTATPASPAARSSSTPMAARRPHGGGAFSGKDPTKVDRSAAYAARYLAKNIVAAGLATPLHDPARLCDRRVASRCRSTSTRTAPARSATTRSRRRSARIAKLGGLTPRGIRTHLGLNKPIYARDRRLRPLRPQGGRRLLPVGAARPGRGSEGRGRRR